MARIGLWRPLVLAGLLAGGFFVVWGLAGVWALEVAQSAVRGERTQEYLVFLADGTPRRLLHVGRQGERQYRDLEGNPAPPPEDENAGTVHGTPLAARLPGGGGADVPWDQRLRTFADGRLPAVYWYFVWDGRPGGTASFVGYDSLSHARVGYLGTAGFRPEVPPEAERFPYEAPGQGVVTCCGTTPGVLSSHPSYPTTAYPRYRVAGRAPRGSVSGWDVYVVGRDHTLYHVDLQRRTVDVALHEPALVSAALVAGPADPVRGTPYRPVVRTDDAVRVLDEDGHEAQRYPIPEALRARAFAFLETAGGEAVMYWTSPTDGMRTTVDYHIFWVAPDGRSREAAASLPWFGGSPSVRVLAGALVPSPAGSR